MVKLELQHRRTVRHVLLTAHGSLLTLVAACGPVDRRNSDDSIPFTVYAAGSLARPMRAALDSFRVSTATEFSLELSGSLDLARRVTELGQVPDLIALADEEVFPSLLMPAHTGWYARFARNRMVVARKPGSPAAGDWRRALSDKANAVGRADPDVDPAGYRTLMVFQLAERHLGDTGLAARLLAAAPVRHVRPKSAELVALLQAGELDFAWMYESSARGARLPFDTLPSAIDLGSDADSSTYAAVAVRVLGARPGDTLTMQGAPIHYGLSIPTAARRRDTAEAFVRFLFSERGRGVLRGEYLDALESPRIVGIGAPSFLADSVPSAR